MTQHNGRFRARFGILVPFTNTNLEPDLVRLCPADISLHFARLGGYDAEAVPDAAQMSGLGAASLEEPLRLIAGVTPDVVFYGCTSATLTQGVAFDRDLAARIKQRTGAHTVTAAGALVQALQACGVSRVGLASPYVGAINRAAEHFLAQAGIETVCCADIGRTLDNTGQGALTPDEIYALGLRANHPDAEALVLSCTDMRSVETLEQLETAVQKPVVCSNQAMMYQALRLLTGCSLQPPFEPVRCGQLFEKILQI